MSKVDSRVVQMRFDNAQFESGIKTSQTSLEGLKKALDTKGSGNALKDLQQSARDFSLSGIGTAVDSIRDKFSALSIAGITALTNIVNKAVDAGGRLVKSIALDPIMDGFSEYELKMGSIQTILANTARHGTTLEQVTATLDDLNTYADRTIYNFGDMTRNIGLFTNSGMKVEDATSAIKGFSNEAAASGTNAQQAAGAAYQLSQALSAGVVRLMDWKSLSNAGMGNANMRQGLIDLAVAMGTFSGGTKEAELAAKDFNGSLESGWLTADVMMNYLKIQAQDLNAEQMRSLGLTDEQIARMEQQAATALDAATKVRTWTQLIGTMAERVGSSWAQTFETLFGDFNEATDLFTSIDEQIGEIIDGAGNARNAVIQGWKDLGGRQELINSFWNVFNALMSVLRPIGEAFSQIFPPVTAERLFQITENISKFTEKLILSESSMENLRRTFAGVFAIFSIFGQVVSAILGAVLGPFADGLGEISQNFLLGSASVGDWLVAFDAMLKQTGVLETVSNAVGGALSVLMDIVRAVGSALRSLFDGKGLSLAGAIDETSTLYRVMSTLGEALDGPIDLARKFGEVVSAAFRLVIDAIHGVEDSATTSGAMASYLAAAEGLRLAWERVKNVLGALKVVFGPVVSGILDVLSRMGAGIAEFVKTLDPTLLQGSLNIGGFIVILKLIKSFVDKFQGPNLIGGLGDVIEGLSGAFGELSGTLKAMQKDIMAGAIVKIAIAIGLLAASLLLLSAIPQEKLAGSLLALAGISVVLGGFMASLELLANSKGFFKLPIISASLVMLGGALLLMSFALRNIATVDPADAVKGVVALAGVLAATNLARGGSINAVALFGLALAVRVLASAFKVLAELSWAELGKGGAVIGSVVAAMAGLGAIKFSGGGMVQAAASMVILGGALLVLSFAIKTMAAIEMGAFGKGLGLIAATLGVLVVALRAFPKNVAGQVLGLMGLSIALGMLTGVLAVLGAFSPEMIVKSLITLAGALGILVAAMNLMQGGLVGAGAMVVIALAIGLLVPSLVSLSQLTWGELAIGLIGLAAALAVIGGAAYLLAPVIPLIVLLGAGIGLLGLGLAGIGAALFLAGAGLSLIAGAGLAAIPVVLAFAATLPYLAAQLGVALIAFLTAIAAGIPQLVEAVSAILLALIQALEAVLPEFVDLVFDFLTQLTERVTEYAPTFGEAARVLIEELILTIESMTEDLIEAAWNIIMAFIDAAGEKIPEIQDKGFQLIEDLLQGIEDNIGDLATAAADVITEFMDAMEIEIPRVADAGLDMVIEIMKGLTDAINDHKEEFRTEARKLSDAVIDGLVAGITSATPMGRIGAAVASLGTRMLGGLRGALNINSPSKEAAIIGDEFNEGVVLGLDRSANTAYDAASSVGTGAISALKSSISGLQDAVNADLDLNPTITPVLDLSTMTQQAGGIGDILAPAPIDVAPTFDRLRSVPDPTRPSETSSNIPVSNVQAPSTEVVFNQYNSSPEALSEAEIYRRTQNQIAMLKRGVPV